MIDEIDTNSNFDEKKIPDGEHLFRVMDVRKNAGMYIWTLSYEGVEGEQVLFPNSMGALLKVLGCKESDKKGIYVLDTDKIQGKQFKATVFQKADKNDKSKLYQNMKDFKVVDDIPF